MLKVCVHTMDLQSILDASDDDDSSHERGNASPYRISDVGSSQIDIEALLREDDDDDEDDLDNSGASNNGGGSPHKQFNKAWESTPVDQSFEMLIPPKYTSNGNHHHKTDDWAVLQAILGEEDEDDDDDMEFNRPRNDWTTSRLYSDGAAAGDGIQAILQFDTEDHHEDTSTVTMTLPTGSSRVSPPRQPGVHGKEEQNGIEATSPVKVNAPVKAETDDAKESKSESPPPSGHDRRAGRSVPISLPRPPATFLPSAPSPPSRRPLLRGMSTALYTAAQEAHEADIAARALQQAMAYERKLLKAGHREIVSPLMVKRRLKPKVTLSRRQHNVAAASASTVTSGTTTPRLVAAAAATTTTTTAAALSRRAAHHLASHFNFSGVVENKTMTDLSVSLHKHADASHKVHCGLPTCLAFNSKFIAIGTQLGIILLYDLFEVLRQRLGAGVVGAALDKDHAQHPSKVAGAITSLDLNYNGEMVIAGYTTGILVLWDTIKGVVLRTVQEHVSPVTAVRFLVDLKVVTVDAGGLVNKLTFSRNMLWSNYNMETECLLDGTAGQILALHVLSPYWMVNPNLQPKSLAPVLRKLTLLALSSERSSFAVAVEPAVHVLHRWARPPADRTNPKEGTTTTMHHRHQVYLPCLAWGWALVSGANNEAMPMLARSWGCCLQFLSATFPTTESETTESLTQSAKEAKNGEATIHWPAFGVHDEIDAAAPIVALEWLNNRSLVYLTASQEFTLVDTVMMTMLERLDFSGLRLVYAEFSLSRSVSVDKDERKQLSCTTFQNSMRSSDDRLMVLCQEELKCISIVGARRRVSSLEEDGEWLEALALALDHYENTVVSQENRKRDQSGLRDLARHPEFSSGFTKSEDEEWIAKLLIRYMNLAVENAPETSTDHRTPYTSAALSSIGGAGQTKIDLAQSHFQMLAGVCVEFCVVTRRLDLLYGPIFRRFQSVGYTTVFLDVLEPYVLNDKLSYIAPEVMSFFVDHCKATNGIATVERCLLHMDCTIMDFDSILSLLRANDMYTALCFVFNQGLDDFATPFEILLERIFDEGDAGHILVMRRKDAVPQNDFERFGYKAILYLRTCFEGKTFPQHEPLKPEERVQTVRASLIKFVMQERYKPSPYAKKTKDRMFVLGQRAHSYPYLRVLMQVDPKSILDTLAIAIDAPDADVMAQTAGLQFDKQEIVDVLSAMIWPTAATGAERPESLIRMQSATNAFLEFSSKYIVQGMARVDKETATLLFGRLAERFSSAQDTISKKAAQSDVMELLSAMPRDTYDPDKVLEIIDMAGLHRAALLLHQQVASSWQDAASEDIDLRSGHFQNAIDCYLGDEDVDFRKQVFEYIRKECSGVSNTATDAFGNRAKTLRDALFPKLAALVQLDAVLMARVVAELLLEDLDKVVDTIELSGGPQSQFLFLQAVVSGDLARLDSVAGSVLKLSVEHQHKHLGLMARLHPEMVYEYLSMHDNYRPEDALKLCQQHEIADASAYLLERMGNVSSALQLILQTLESRMMVLKRTIRGMGVDSFRSRSRRRHGDDSRMREASAKQEKETDSLKRILIVALDLCERNSKSLTATSSRSEQGSQLWFNVLDRLINAKSFLRLGKEQPGHASAMANVLSDLLRLAMQRMVSNVALPDLVRKVTSDHSGSRLSDLREMVESLLSTYSFEQNVFDCALDVFRQDLRNMDAAQRRLQLEGSPVLSVMNASLTSPDAVDMTRDRARQQGMLCLSPTGDACFVDGEQTYSQRAESGLTKALTTLRSRRVTGSATSTTATRNRSFIALSTVTEREYQAYEIEPVVYGDRIAGGLGDAQHRGRVVTFSA